MIASLLTVMSIVEILYFISRHFLLSLGIIPAIAIIIEIFYYFSVKRAGQSTISDETGATIAIQSEGLKCVATSVDAADVGKVTEEAEQSKQNQQEEQQEQERSELEQGEACIEQQAEFEKADENTEGAEKDLQELTKELSEQEIDFQKREEKLLEREEKLREREKKLQKRERKIQDQKNELHKEKIDFQQRERKFQDTEIAIDNRERQSQEREKELQVREKELQEQEVIHLQREEKLQEWQGKLQEREEKRQKWESDFESRVKNLHEWENKFQKRYQNLKEQEKEHQEQNRKKQEELEQKRKEYEFYEQRRREKEKREEQERQAREQEKEREQRREQYKRNMHSQSGQEYRENLDGFDEEFKTGVYDEPSYYFPPLDFMQFPESTDNLEETRRKTQLFSDTLSSFGIEPNITDMVCGPSVTFYKLRLNSGVKFDKIKNRIKDIEIAMGVSNIYIAPVLGEPSTIGIEIPNLHNRTVYLREILDSKEFYSSKSPATFALGMGAHEDRFITDISKLRHLLIAGNKGSGKTTCLNSLVASLLYKASPDEVKLILIDSTMMELCIFNGIPHLLQPVILDKMDAINALQSIIEEITERYFLMNEQHVKDINSYNHRIAYDLNRKKLPHIIIVINELAELMVFSSEEIEKLLCQIAQNGAQAGVHLIMATQKILPGVITNEIKACIPSRIALKVDTAAESRMILNVSGAEHLLGNGDMLYSSVGENGPIRIQGSYVSGVEIERIKTFIKNNGT